MLLALALIVLLGAYFSVLRELYADQLEYEKRCRLMCA